MRNLPYAALEYVGFPLGTTIATNTLTTFEALPDFGESYNSDPTVFSLSPTQGRITCLKQGLYVCEGAVLWDGDITGRKLMRVEWSTIYSAVQSNTTEVEEPEDEISSRALALTSGEPINLDGSFEQRSGANQQLLLASLVVCQLSPYPIPGGVTTP